MIAPKIPDNETIRIKALKSFSILDTFSEKEFDEITLLASIICETPMSLISLIDGDRQWFKSKVGIDLEETSREISFCGHAILNEGQLFTVENSRLDERFYDNPLVLGLPNVVFYAGAPLVTSEGLSLGTLCVLDNKPKILTATQQKAMEVLSNKIISLFELKKANLLLEKINIELETQRAELEMFANVAAHDMRSPLKNITALTEVLMDDYNSLLDDDGKELVKMLNMSSITLKDLVDGILHHSKTGTILQKKEDVFDLKSFIQDTIQLIDGRGNYSFTTSFENQTIAVNKVALQQIFINLISNSVKYNDKEQVEIEIGFTESEFEYQFYVSDNGMGIAKEYQERIFKIFEILGVEDRFGKKGNGIGLSTVKKLIEGLGGAISVDSEIDKGTKVSFSVLK
ncbi:sensor histidine kinase [Flavobacterium taihuense]|uniref:histidine kinase n=1 Tax=Flavobacterium taihuense TaxID=2857508 RepID=A0ABS6XRB0_9FLAO|nr:ATP-binding protein [Flavobacterium taihuense]MBW4359205.1 GAF domain-containing protein [Flavobacterium taihuense]